MKRFQLRHRRLRVIARFCSIYLTSNYVDFFTANVWLIRLAYMSAKGAWYAVKKYTNY